MDNSIWVKMHGGTTHFPIALVMASVAFDLAGVIAPDHADRSRRAGFRAAGYYTLLLAALGSIGAVVDNSGGGATLLTILRFYGQPLVCWLRWRPGAWWWEAAPPTPHSGFTWAPQFCPAA
jgi:H+/gluconate symporter-like permease